jgi:hypothetical protein
MEDNNQCKQRHVRDYGGQKQIKNQFMSSQTFHRTPCVRVQETTAWERLELRKLELLDPIDQEQHWNRDLQQQLEKQIVERLGWRNLAWELACSTR